MLLIPIGAVLMILTAAQAVHAASTQVQALQYCEINSLGVGAQTIVDVTIHDELEGKTYAPRYLFKIDCSRETGRCEGLRFNLGNIEAGKPIQLLDATLAKDIRLVSVQGRVATIAWTRLFSGVTITIDLDRQRFEYRSSGKFAQALGASACPRLDLTIPKEDGAV